MKFYQPGVPDTIDVPTQPLIELLETAVQQSGNQVALEFFGATKTYRELADEVARAAEGLRRLGVGPGDRVALLLPTCPQHYVAFYACMRIGAIVVEHNPLYTDRELRHMFEDHSARVAICWDKAVENLHRQPEDIEIGTVISVNLTEELPAKLRFALALPLPALRKRRSALTTPVKGTIPWRKLLKNSRIAKGYPRPKASDIAVIQYTSGTTGRPKGAILTHANLYSNARQADAWIHDARLGKETVYAVLPLFHAFGLTFSMTYAILKQAHIVLFPTFDVKMVMDAAAKNPPTAIAGVPAIFESMANESKRRNISLRRTKFCMSGAMTLPVSVAENWESVAGGMLIEGYGMTEASPVALGNPFWSSRKLGSIGLPFPSTEVRIVDPDNPDQDVRSGEPGELLVRGPQVFAGYWRNPEETARILLPNGWLRTGDVGVQDTDGFVTIVDRLKELIITGGFNVSPTEVESVLLAHPDIVDAAVVGIPSSHSGEEVTAAVILDEGARLDVAEVKEFCRERLTRYKVPRRFVAVPSLPKTMLGKVLRKKVREQLLGMLAHD